MERKMHIETIESVKKFIQEKDYEGLKKYIENREQAIAAIPNMDESDEYINSLVNGLK